MPLGEGRTWQVAESRTCKGLDREERLNLTAEIVNGGLFVRGSSGYRIWWWGEGTQENHDYFSI